MPFAQTSLATRTLSRMGIRIAIVIVVATVLTYWHLYDALQGSLLNGLRDYVDARGRGESEQFLLAETQTRMLTDEFMKRLILLDDSDPKAEFDAIFSRYPDGLWRVRPDINDFHTKATIFVRHDVEITPDLRRRLVTAYHLLSEWGTLTTNRFLDSFMNMPEQLSVNFAPFVDWSMEAKRDTDIYTYETVWRSTKKKNPERKPFWTSVYFDEGAKKWMVSHVTPGDLRGRWVISSGHDIVIDDLVKRTANQQLAGTYNIILRQDGQLIAHPRLTAQIQKAGGNLSVDKLNDPALSAIVSSVLKTAQVPAIAESADGSAFLGISQVRGPNWYFVTVYPKSLLRKLAFDNASFVLGLGALSLLIELILLNLVLRRHVAQPLQSLISATERIRSGDWNVRIETPNPDEVGRLGHSFSAMAQSLGERDRQLLRSAQDLAEQVQIAKANEARLHAISQAMPDAFFVVDRHGQILEATGNHTLFYHPAPRSKYLRDILPADLAGEVMRVVERCLDTGETQIYEYPLSINEQPRWFEGRIARLSLPNERDAVVWLARDVTERKVAEIELRQARDNLEQRVAAQTADLTAARDRADAANQAKTQFLSNMSHELRTPMHAILSFARLGLEKSGQVPPDKLRRYFTNISDSGERMLALVNDLLDIARLESGKMAYTVALQPIRPVIDQTIAELDELVGGKALQVLVEPADFDLSFPFDSLRIGQVLRNLLSNAIKFSGERSSIEIELSVLSTPSPRLVVKVMDRGIGIPAGELESIFDKFVQSSLTAREVGGTGLGLPICREIVRGHGGEIHAEHRVGGGTTITFWLPLSDDTQAVGAAAG